MTTQRPTERLDQLWDSSETLLLFMSVWKLRREMRHPRFAWELVEVSGSWCCRLLIAKCQTYASLANGPIALAFSPSTSTDEHVHIHRWEIKACFWNGRVRVNLHSRLREDHLTESLWLSLDPLTSPIKWNGGVVWMSGWFLCVPPLNKEGRYLVNCPRYTASDCSQSDQYSSSSMFHTIVLYVYICDPVGEAGVPVGVFVLSNLLFQVHVYNGNN